MAALVLTCYLSAVATDVCRVHVSIVTICEYKCNNNSKAYYSIHQPDGQCQQHIRIKK